MRAKLTAKHPRPASAERAPVRAGSPSARKPVRAPKPVGAGAGARGAAAAKGAAGSGGAAPRGKAKDSGTATGRREVRTGAAGAAKADRPGRVATAGDARGPRARAGDERAPRSRTGDDARGFRPRTGEDARGPRSRAAGDDRPPRSRTSDDSRGFRPRTGDDARGPRSRPPGDERPPRARASDDSRGFRSRTGAEDRAPRAGTDRNERPRSTRSAGDAGQQRPYGAARGTDDERGARSFARPIKGDYAQRQQHSEPEAKRARSAAPGRPAPRNNDRNNDRDHDTDAHASAPHRERHDAPGSLRLSKLMSELGLCSRREADEWIEKGWVLVDGERIDTLGTKVRPDARIDIDPAAEAAQARSVTILLHKPVGFVSGQAEDGYEPAITLITPANHWEGDRSEIRFAPSHLRQLAPAGRLDIDSTGLLVLTQDGRVAKQLIGGHSEVDKEYLVRVAYGDVETNVDAQFPLESLAQLRHGLELDGVPLKTAMVSWQNGEQLRFVLREGKKRQIRRMCELVGLRVVGLKRVRMGKVALGALPQGQWRYLSVDETF
ncbi:MAG TPA: pseudouridine synthase [Paraburkholderia sp.]|nr:pseudouridine synthase [Paraburkholderia sp.]